METHDDTIPYSALESDLGTNESKDIGLKKHNKVRKSVLIILSVLLVIAVIVVVLDVTHVFNPSNNNNNNSDSNKKKSYNSKTSLSKHSSNKVHTKNMMASKYLFSNNDKTDASADADVYGDGGYSQYGNGIRRLLDDTDTDSETNGTADISMTNYDDVQYYGSISMGGQYFTVLFDSGSSDLWLPGIDCADCNCSNLYDCDASDSCVDSTSEWSITYGSGSASGYLVEDVLEVEGLEATVTFGVATVDADSASMLFDGIFGMAFLNLSEEEVTPAFMDLYDQSQVNSEVFAFYLTDNEESTGSELVFGGYDDDHFTGDIAWTDITHPLYFTVDCKSMEMDNVDTFFSASAGCIIDSGTSYLIGPPADITALYDNVLSAYDSVTYYKYLGSMIVDCDDKSNLPDLTITIGDNDDEFVITWEEYVIEYNDECVVAFSHIYGIDFWILGDVFMKKYYSIFDMENRQMGFATAV